MLLWEGHSQHPDLVFFSGLLLSEHHIQLQLPGGQKEGAVWGRPEPNPASPGCCITKAGAVFAALTLVSSVTQRASSWTRPSLLL